MENITVTTFVKAPAQRVWDYYTNPEHITEWNFADPSWHCPEATNDMKLGGKYHARMEARDGSFGFDFDAVYTQIEPGRSFAYLFGGRTASVVFEAHATETQVQVTFEPETENSVDMQRAGWQSILDNFKRYVEKVEETGNR